MEILDHQQIERKITRLAFEILEHNYENSRLLLAGINQNGMAFGTLLLNQLQSITDKKIELSQISLDPADPLSNKVNIDYEKSALDRQNIVIVDDVANTGRTIFYACKSLLETLPQKVEVAVLVDRKHKSFPIHVDYVGLSLATTLKENIDVRLDREGKHSAHLK